MDNLFKRNDAGTASTSQQETWHGKAAARQLNPDLNPDPIRAKATVSRRHCLSSLCSRAALCGALLLGSGSVAMAQSPTWFGNSADGAWLVGGKIGTLQNGRGSFTDAQTFTLMLGYQFNRSVADTGSAAIEVELITTYDSGGIRNSSSEWDADNIAAYMTYRTTGDIYFKAKLGLYSSDLEVKSNGQSNGSVTDTAFGFGVGLGFRFKNNVNMELEFSGNTSDDVNDLSGFSLGAHVKF